MASLITPGIPDVVLARTTPEGRKVFGVQTDAQYHLVELRALDPVVLPPDRWLTRLVVAERGRWTRRLPDTRGVDRAIRESGDEFIRLAFSNLYREVARRAGVPESVLARTEFFRAGGMIESEYTPLVASVSEEFIARAAEV